VIANYSLTNDEIGAPQAYDIVAAKIEQEIDRLVQTLDDQKRLPLPGAGRGLRRFLPECPVNAQLQAAVLKGA
jgi:hypothetical protein